MNKFTKTTILSIGAMATIAAPIATVVSCGSGSQLNPSGVLTIARWGNDVESASQDKAINQFVKSEKAAGRDVEVKTITLDYGKRIDQISKWAASGNLPDIIETDGADYSSYAEASLIKKLDSKKIGASTLSGLVPASLGTMVGNVKNEKWSYGVIPNQITASTLSGDSSLWGMPKEFNTLGTYINKKTYNFEKNYVAGNGLTNGPTTDATYDKYKAAWEAEQDKTNDKLFKLLKFLYKTTDNGLKAKNGKKIGVMSFTNDPNRFTQYFSEADYNAYKGYTASDIKANKDKIASSIKSWYPSLSSEYQDMNQSNGALTSHGHGYGWNGEAFDMKAIGAVIEGAWYTPSSKFYSDINSWDIWEAPKPGLFPQGWALSQGSNDDDVAYRFMTYMASHEGSKLETSLTGANPVNKTAIVEQYTEAKAIYSNPDSSVEEKGRARKILSHSKGFIIDGQTPKFNPASKSMRPLLFTSEYPLFQKAWQDGFSAKLKDDKTVSNSEYNAIIDGVINDWIDLISDAA